MIDSIMSPAHASPKLLKNEQGQYMGPSCSAFFSIIYNARDLLSLPPIYPAITPEQASYYSQAIPDQKASFIEKRF